MPQSLLWMPLNKGISTESSGQKVEKSLEVVSAMETQKTVCEKPLALKSMTQSKMADRSLEKTDCEVETWW